MTGNDMNGMVFAIVQPQQGAVRRLNRGSRGAAVRGSSPVGKDDCDGFRNYDSLRAFKKMLKLVRSEGQDCVFRRPAMKSAPPSRRSF